MGLSLNEQCIGKKTSEALGLSIVVMAISAKNMGEEEKVVLLMEVMGNCYWLYSLEQKDEDIAADLDNLD